MLWGNGIPKSWVSVAMSVYLCSYKENLVSLHLKLPEKQKVLHFPLIKGRYFTRTTTKCMESKQINSQSPQGWHAGEAGIEYFWFHQKQEIKQQKKCASGRRHHQFWISSLFCWFAVCIKPSQKTQHSQTHCCCCCCCHRVLLFVLIISSVAVWSA